MNIQPTHLQKVLVPIVEELLLYLQPDWFAALDAGEQRSVLAKSRRLINSNVLPESDLVSLELSYSQLINCFEAERLVA